MAMRIYVSSEEAAFFNNNKMGYADSIPTSGSYKVGDFIISSTQLNGIFGWVCTEEGTPGKWEVIGSGASGGGKLVSINASKVIDTAVNQISLTELGLAVDSKDKLIVHFNSMFLMEGVDYQITADGSMITKLGGGNWNESNIAGCLFTFELLKNVENVDTEEIKLDSKLICEKNNVTVTGAVSEVNIGISGFNKSKDTLIVYKNATYLIEGVDYEVSSDSSKIVSLNGVWNESAESDYIFTFVVFKEVATINPEAVVDTTNIVDGSVTMDKLSSDVKQAIENASNIDLSGYAVRADVGDKSQLQTTEKGDLVGAINELFQNANNGKELIADAIGEPLVSSDTFSAMSNGIKGLTSSFKTALMNNGISIESSDKFKQLIDKLALLADSESKGIQYASETISSSEIKTGSFDHYSSNIFFNSNNVYYLTINDLKFTPSVIIITGSHIYRNETRMTYGVFDIMNNMPYYVICSAGDVNLADAKNLSGTIKSAYCYDMTVSNSMDFPLGFAVNTSYPATLNNFTWYAFGVGEEDTTLLDSLKSILVDESVEVTDTDTMADLIVKTDTEFTNKKEDLKNIMDIINVEYNENDSWDELINKINNSKKVYLYKEGNECIDITGGWSDLLINSSYTNNTESYVNKYDSYMELYFTHSNKSNYPSVYVRTNNPIELAGAKNINIDFETISYTANTGFTYNNSGMGLNDSETISLNGLNIKHIAFNTNNCTIERKIITQDIGTLSSGYFAFKFNGYMGDAVHLKINNIWIEKW